MRLSALLLLCSLFGAGSASAAMVARPVDYSVGETHFQGQLVYDDAIAGQRPGLLMVPNWYGVNADAIAKAKQIAGRDYVILLADLYGREVHPSDDAAALAAVKPLYADRALMRARVGAAFEQLRAQAAKAPIDTARLAAIGFCFGGSAVLDLARSGSNVAAVVSFHGNLSTDDPALAKGIRAHVLVLHGADDKGVNPQVDAFLGEMRASSADWQFVAYGGAVHCFTEQGQDKPGCRYDAKVARRAYAAMREWLAEAFASP